MTAQRRRRIATRQKTALECRMLRPYRLVILASSPGADMRVVEERDIRAPNAGVAIDEMYRMSWPPKATFVRLIDLDGKVILERPRD